eukprot:scaffold625215_cov18-Prasinocladus_malaysianus.AAC.1
MKYGIQSVSLTCNNLIIQIAASNRMITTLTIILASIDTMGQHAHTRQGGTHEAFKFGIRAQLAYDS